MRNGKNNYWRRLLVMGGLLLALGACNSTDPPLGVEQPESQAATPPDSGQVTAQTQEPTQPQTASIAPADLIATVYFAPVVGAPVTNVTALSRRLSSAAPLSGIKLEPSSSITINHEIRGYFSALSESGTITVIHVWDVFTPQGQRVHRIQGEEKIVGAASDPWAAVPAATMEKIADTVLSQYASWRGAAQG